MDALSSHTSGSAILLSNLISSNLSDKNSQKDTPELLKPYNSLCSVLWECNPPDFQIWGQLLSRLSLGMEMLGIHSLHLLIIYLGGLEQLPSSKFLQSCKQLQHYKWLLQGISFMPTCNITCLFPAIILKPCLINLVIVSFQTTWVAVKSVTLTLIFGVSPAMFLFHMCVKSLEHFVLGAREIVWTCLFLHQALASSSSQSFPASTLCSPTQAWPIKYVTSPDPATNASRMYLLLSSPALLLFFPIIPNFYKEFGPFLPAICIDCEYKQTPQGEMKREKRQRWCSNSPTFSRPTINDCLVSFVHFQCSVDTPL